MFAFLGGKSNNTVLPSPTLEFASICLKNALTLLTLAINEANDKNQIEVARPMLFLRVVSPLAAFTDARPAVIFSPFVFLLTDHRTKTRLRLLVL